MTQNYNTRAKKDSAVTSQSLQNLEDNTVKIINNVKEEIINLKETVIKWLQGENEKLREKYQKFENKLNTLKPILMP